MRHLISPNQFKNMLKWKTNDGFKGTWIIAVMWGNFVRYFRLKLSTENWAVVIYSVWVLSIIMGLEYTLTLTRMFILTTAFCAEMLTTDWSVKEYHKRSNIYRPAPAAATEAFMNRTGDVWTSGGDRPIF